MRIAPIFLMTTACLWAAAFGQPAASPLAQSRPESSPSESQPAAQRLWGQAKAGLQVSLQFLDAPAVGEPLRISVAIRNAGTAAIQLPDRAEVFAWLFLVQDDTDGKKAWFSEKIFPPMGDKGDWPASLEGQKELELPAADVATMKVFLYEKGLKVADGYPSAGGGGQEIKPLPGTLCEQLSVGKLQARLMLYLPRGKEGSILAASNTLDVAAGPPRLAKLSAEGRKQFMADLLKQFDRDAFGAQAAHHTAVRLGPDALADLIEAASNAKRPDYSRMWLATAIADIRDGRAAAALEKLLDSADGAVRACIAYHGPKQHSDSLDKAIVARVAKSTEGSYVSYALLGFLVFRKSVPPELLEAGLDSADPKARAAAANAMKNYASDFNVEKLRQLAKDSDPRVAQTAQRILKAMNVAE
ncbi:MAG: hypothetical protein HZA50_13305 [Planctomycetes bacterium]|nr:hypothetical protein [Planctomycetota bacterium]